MSNTNYELNEISQYEDSVKAWKVEFDRCYAEKDINGINRIHTAANEISKKIVEIGRGHPSDNRLKDLNQELNVLIHKAYLAPYEIQVEELIESLNKERGDSQAIENIFIQINDLSPQLGGISNSRITNIANAAQHLIRKLKAAKLIALLNKEKGNPNAIKQILTNIEFLKKELEYVQNIQKDPLIKQNCQSLRIKLEKDVEQFNLEQGSQSVTSIQNFNSNVSKSTEVLVENVKHEPQQFKSDLQQKELKVISNTALKKKLERCGLYVDFLEIVREEVRAKALFEYAETSELPQKDNIYALLNLACDHYKKVSPVEQKQIKLLLKETYNFLTGSQGDLELMKEYSNQLDSTHCPYWLKVMIGIVFLIILVALLLAAIALVLSITLGTAAPALIAPIIMLFKPIIDVVAGISIAGITTGAMGVTAATWTIAGANTLGAGIFGLCSFFVMKRPFTDCVMNIINTQEALLKT